MISNPADARCWPEQYVVSWEKIWFHFDVTRMLEMHFDSFRTAHTLRQSPLIHLLSQSIRWDRIIEIHVLFHVMKIGQGSREKNIHMIYRQLNILNRNILWNPKVWTYLYQPFDEEFSSNNKILCFIFDVVFYVLPWFIVEHKQSHCGYRHYNLEQLLQFLLIEL